MGYKDVCTNSSRSMLTSGDKRAVQQSFFVALAACVEPKIQRSESFAAREQRGGSYGEQWWYYGYPSERRTGVCTDVLLSTTERVWCLCVPSALHGQAAET